MLSVSVPSRRSVVDGSQRTGLFVQKTGLKSNRGGPRCRREGRYDGVRDPGVSPTEPSNGANLLLRFLSLGTVTGAGLTVPSSRSSPQSSQRSTCPSDSSIRLLDPASTKDGRLQVTDDPPALPHLYSR